MLIEKKGVSGRGIIELIWVKKQAENNLLNRELTW